jgi:hypothetical protein
MIAATVCRGCGRVQPGWELSHDADGVSWHPDCWERAQGQRWSPPPVPLTDLAQLIAAKPAPGDYHQWRGWYSSVLALILRLSLDEHRADDARLTERQRAVRYGVWRRRVKPRPRQLEAAGMPDYLVSYWRRYWQRRAARRRAAARRASGRSAATA